MAKDQLTTGQQAAVRAAVRETLSLVGIEACDPHEMQKDFVFLREFRRLCESVGNKVVIVIVGSLTAGIAGAIWFAIKAKC